MLVDLLEFGFPLDLANKVDPQLIAVNHDSATKYLDHVDKYLNKEIDLSAIFGPYKEAPI